MSGGIYDCYSWVKMLLGSGEWVEPGMLLITPQCPQWPHREPPGPEFSSVQGGPCPQPEEPWLGSQTTPLPQPLAWSFDAPSCPEAEMLFKCEYGHTPITDPFCSPELWAWGRPRGIPTTGPFTSNAPKNQFCIFCS